MNGITIPLHLRPGDYSQAACEKRYDLHVRMSALNPNGWRKPSKKTGVVNGRITRLAATAYGLGKVA